MIELLIIVSQLTAVDMVSVKIHSVDSHVPVIKATLDRYVKQSLIIVIQSTAVHMVSVKIHTVGSYVFATKATLDKSVKW